MTRFRVSGTNWEGRRWVLGGALVDLAGEIEAIWTDRHPSDGTVASRTHDRTNPRSDHRPYPYSGAGVVYALDAGETTEDDGAALAEALRELRDGRLRYLIHEGRLYSSYDHAAGPAWEWRPYSGANLHPGHVHVSTYRNVPAGAWGIASVLGMAQFTAEDVEILRDLAGAVRHRRSNGAALGFLIDDARQDIITRPELAAALEALPDREGALTRQDVLDTVVAALRD